MAEKKVILEEFVESVLPAGTPTMSVRHAYQLQEEGEKSTSESNLGEEDENDILYPNTLTEGACMHDWLLL